MPTAAELQAEFDELIAQGLYAIVDMGLLEKARNFEISSNVHEYALETLQSYKEYLKILEQLPPNILKLYLETLKKTELRNNHESESENSFLLEMFESLDSSNSINMAAGIVNRKGILDVEDIKALHMKVMQGTSEQEEDNYNFRKDNCFFVGSFVGGQRQIDFFPMRAVEVPQAMEVLTEYLNLKPSSEEDILFQPMIVHALIAAIQAFPDGNTRLARLILHIKLWQLSKEFHLTTIHLPAIYMSKNFLLVRKSYRDHICRMVVDKTDEAWNRWLNLNLNAMNEQLYYSMNNLEEAKKRFQ